MDTNEVATESFRTEAPTPTLRRIDDLPSPKAWPFFGHTLQIKIPQFHQQMEQWSRELGKYYWFTIASRRYLVVADHQAIAKALRDRPDGFDRTKQLTDVFIDMRMKVGLFGAEGDVWRKQRRMVMSAFDPAHVKEYFPTMTRVTGRLESRWNKSLGSDIDLTAELMRFTVDTITGLAFGHDVNTLESGEDVIQAHLDKIFPALFQRLLAPFPYWRYIRLPSDRALDRSLTEVTNAIDRFVAEARERIRLHPQLREHPSNLLEAMINATDQGDSGLTDDDVAGNVITMLLAGEDTTANSIAWLLSLVWANPATLQKLQSEVRSTFAADEAFTIEKLSQLDYLDACISESMRLKPVAPFLALQALKDTVIGDVQVPVGTLIFTVLRHDSVDDHYIPNAADFDPERWLDHTLAGTNSAKRISMPFGAGPRICPGRYLALLEMKIAIAMLLTRFEIDNISAPGGQAAQEHMAFTMVPVGLKMRLKSRKYGL
ncbi:cytochrome P450 [Oxalobacteraceae bacterium GrIS 2.11]